MIIIGVLTVCQAVAKKLPCMISFCPSKNPGCVFFPSTLEKRKLRFPGVKSLLLGNGSIKQGARAGTRVSSSNLCTPPTQNCLPAPYKCVQQSVTPRL